MKTLKFNKYLIFSVIAVFSFTSCQDDFLDRVPTGDISSETAINSVAAARSALNGVHRYIYSWDNNQDETGHNSLMIANDILGEDVVMHANGNGWWVFDCRWLSNASTTGSLTAHIWRFYYTVISNVNTILEGIDGASTTSEADRADVKGQALVYRAWAYFNLIQWYGQRYDAAGSNTGLGVPLVLAPTREGLPRSTVQQVYAQINQDLDDAIELFEDFSPARPDKSNLDLSVARGVKAQVALVQQNWTVARDMAAAARQSYTLMSRNDYQQGFNDYTNGEWIWGSHMIPDHTVFFGSFFAYMSHNFNSTNIRTNPKKIFVPLYNSFPDSDIRKKNFSLTGLPVDSVPRADAIRTPYQNKKFRAASTADSYGDIPYMRAAEMYLIEAEARVELNDDANAAQVLYDLNITRDPNYTLSSSTDQALLDEILLYRRLELWGEGRRFFDLKRRNLPLDRDQTNGNHNSVTINSTYVIPAGDNRWNFVIPQSEMDANPNMVQNPI